MRKPWKFVNIILCLLPFCISANSNEISIEETVPGKIYVEDETAEFKCHVSKPSREEQVVWKVVDPKTNEKIFYSYTIADETPPMSLDKQNKSTFSLVMRRDFSGMQIVCQSTKLHLFPNRIAKLKLNKVKESIPINEVKFASHDLIHGQPIKYKCDVKCHSTANVKLVDFRISHSMRVANNKYKLPDNESTYYQYTLDLSPYKVDVHRLDGIRAECFAATKGFKKAEGNVVSPPKKITVHYFHTDPLLVIQRNITKGRAVSVNVTFSINPWPTGAISNFTVENTNTSEAVSNKSITVNSIGGYKRQAHVEFTPETEGIYKITYKPKMLAKSTVSTIEVVFDLREEKMFPLYAVILLVITQWFGIVLLIFFVYRIKQIYNTKKRWPINQLQDPPEERDGILEGEKKYNEEEGNVEETKPPMV